MRHPRSFALVLGLLLPSACLFAKRREHFKRLIEFISISAVEVKPHGHNAAASRMTTVG